MANVSVLLGMHVCTVTIPPPPPTHTHTLPVQEAHRYASHSTPGTCPLPAGAPAGGLLEAAVQLFLTSFAGLHLDSVFLDFAGSAPLAEGLRAGGVRHVVGWAGDVPPPVLPGMDFAHCFFGLLRTPGVTAPEVGAGAFPAPEPWVARGFVAPPA